MRRSTFKQLCTIAIVAVLSFLAGGLLVHRYDAHKLATKEAQDQAWKLAQREKLEVWRSGNLASIYEKPGNTILLNVDSRRAEVIYLPNRHPDIALAGKVKSGEMVSLTYSPTCLVPGEEEELSSYLRFRRKG